MSAYIEKSIESDTGHENCYWEAFGGRFNLLLSNGPSGPEVADIPNKGVINIAGWKNKEAKEAGKKSQDTKTVAVDLSELESFPAFFTELAQKLVQDETSPFYKGIIKDTEEGV